MKVACVGNMNNNMFSLTRFLRDRGVDTHLLLFNVETSHFHPAADTFDFDYQAYTHFLNWGDLTSFATSTPDDIRNDLKEFDVLIGCGFLPAHASKIGRRVDVFAGYGSDVFDLTKYIYATHAKGWRHWRKNLKWQIESMRFARMQRKGIATAAYALNYHHTYDKDFERLNVQGKTPSIPYPMVYTPTFNPKEIAKYHHMSPPLAEMKILRERHDLIVFHHARHIWKTVSFPEAVKGNDILIRGFADFVRKGKADNPCLVLFEYSVDVDESKKLIRDLALEGHVYWFRLLRRKDLMACLSLADIGTSQFTHSYLANGVVCENLAMAKPLMGLRQDDLYKNDHAELYPMIHIEKPGDVTVALIDYMKRPGYYRDMGEQGRQWLQTHVVERSVDAFVEMIEECARG